MNLLGAKVRYTREPIYRSYTINKMIEAKAYPIAFMTGEWHTITRVSGDYFDFDNSRETSPGIILYTIRNFSGNEWDFTNASEI